MEMRLGKTLTAIRWLQSRPGVRRRLVVAPIAAQLGWEDDLDADDLGPVHILTGPMAKRIDTLERNWDEGGWFVTNYHGLTVRGSKTAIGRSRMVPSPILRKEWDAAALDESPAIKNPQAQVTKACLAYLQPDYRAILTGLPDPEGAQDYVCQMLWAFGRFMGCDSFWKWRHYNMMPGFGGGWVVKHKATKAADAWVRKHCFVLSRKEAGLANRKVRERRYVELPGKVNKALRYAERWFELPDAGLITSNKLTVITWQLGLTGGRFKHLTDWHHDEKLKELRRLAVGELRREPMVVFAAQTAEVYAAAEVMDKLGGCAVVTGEMSKADRDREVKRFQKGKVRHIVANPDALKMGVDLSRSSTMVFLSNTWSAETRAQAEARIEHPLKTDPLLYVDIVADAEVDEDVTVALTAKRQNTVMAKQSLVRALMRRKAA